MKYFSLIISLFLAISLSNTLSAQATSSDATISTIEVKVKGISCGNGLKKICKSVEGVEGVNYCKAIKKARVSTFEVSYQPGEVDEEAIYAAIEATPGCKDPKDRPFEVKSRE